MRVQSIAKNALYQALALTSYPSAERDQHVKPKHGIHLGSAGRLASTPQSRCGREPTHHVVERLQHCRLARGAQRKAVLAIGGSKQRVVVKASAAARQRLKQRRSRCLRTPDVSRRTGSVATSDWR